MSITGCLILLLFYPFQSWVEAGTDGKVAAIAEVAGSRGLVFALKGIANVLTGNFRVGLEITTDTHTMRRHLFE